MLKVSVIIPIYNMEKYLEQCLDSIMSQTLEEIEVICINDGSTDGSVEILKKYELQYKNIKIIHQENSGVGKSRNHGMEVAQGEFVAFMDPDDFYPGNDVLESLFYGAKENDVLICGGSYCSIKEEILITKYFGVHQGYAFAFNQKMKYRNYQFHSGFQRFIYNTDHLKKNNIYFPYYSRYQDPPFLVKALSSVDEFFALKKCTYCYRIGHNKLQLTMKKTIDYALGVLDVLDFSREHQLQKLHANVIELLHDDLAPAIYQHMAEGHTELQAIVQRINNAIDTTLIKCEAKALQSPYLVEMKDLRGFIQNNKTKRASFLRKLYNNKDIIIFGAGKVGEVVAENLKSIDGINIICIAVSDRINNPSIICGIPVRIIYELTEYINALVLIATFKNLHQEIVDLLTKLQFNNIEIVDLHVIKTIKNN